MPEIITGTETVLAAEKLQATIDEQSAELKRVKDALKEANHESAARRIKIDEFNTMLSEKDNRVKEFQELIAKQEALISNSKLNSESMLIEKEVMVKASKLGFRDPEDILKVTKEKLKVVDGKVENLDDILASIAKDKPYLISPKTTSISTFNPGNMSQLSDAEKRHLATNSGADSLFDPIEAMKRGGGVGQIS